MAARKARFGITSTEDKMKARQERFGTKSGGISKEKLAARAKRFGIPASADPSKLVTDDLKRKRMERTQVESHRENFSKAIDQLSQCSDSHQLNTTMVSNYNNLACVHYNYGNPGLAKFYLIRTLTCFEDMGYSTVNEHRVKTLYNLGLCFLHHD